VSCVPSLIIDKVTHDVEAFLRDRGLVGIHVEELKDEYFRTIGCTFWLACSVHLRDIVNASENPIVDVHSAIQRVPSPRVPSSQNQCV
jgi:hypothetical protein